MPVHQLPSGVANTDCGSCHENGAEHGRRHERAIGSRPPEDEHERRKQQRSARGSDELFGQLLVLLECRIRNDSFDAVLFSLAGVHRDQALLLLKGLSHKEVAAARSTSETTIRQQALSIYRKSGLRSRSELSAFFLEDLLLPAGQR